MSKQQTGAQEAPESQNALVARFAEVLTADDQRKKYEAYLPEDVPYDKFTAVVIHAVQQNPDLVQRADRRSLFLACQNAAQDGLVPDNKQGTFVIYNQQVGGQWVAKVRWQPMIGGLRLRLAKHGFDIRAEVVFEHDTFDQDKGDEPRIIHKPAPLTEEPGKIVAAYAIATGPDGKKYREVMRLSELEKVKAASKSSNGPAWTTWEEQMDRKAVAKRLINWLPIVDQDDRLRGLIDRDNEQFDLAAGFEPSDMAKSVQRDIRGAGGRVIEHQESTMQPPAGKPETEKQPAKPPATAKAEKKAKAAPPPPAAQAPTSFESENPAPPGFYEGDPEDIPGETYDPEAEEEDPGQDPGF